MKNVNEDLCHLFLTLLVTRKMQWIDSEVDITETKLFVHVTIRYINLIQEIYV